MTHPSGVRGFIFIYLALLALLALTFGVSFFNLSGSWGLILNLSISFLKAILIGLFFMHLNRSPGLTRVFAAAGFCWLAVLLSLALTDYVSRGWIALPGRWP